MMPVEACSITTGASYGPSRPCGCYGNAMSEGQYRLASRTQYRPYKGSFMLVEASEEEGLEDD